jgi:hypothetical protein
MESIMNSNIVTALIAGTFFAASVVAPAFATNNASTPTPEVVGPQIPKLDAIPDIKLPGNLPNIETIGERLKNLDVGEIVDRNRDVVDPHPEPVVLPEVVLPEVVPLELEPVAPMVPAPPEPSVEGAAPVVTPQIEERTGPAVKDIVADTKAEKASILAAYGGDRRAAKAELKASQMRMVERIKARNGARKNR